MIELFVLFSGLVSIMFFAATYRILNTISFCFLIYGISTIVWAVL